MNNRLIKNPLCQKKFQLISQSTSVNNLPLLSGRMKLNQKPNIDTYTKPLAKKLRRKNTNPISKTIKIANMFNKQADTINNYQQLKWIITDGLCSRHTKCITYANVKRYDGHDSHTYFISIQKDGTFYLHIVVYYDCTINENHIEQISQIYSTIEEAKKRVTSHYLNYLISTKNTIPSKFK